MQLLVDCAMLERSKKIKEIGSGTFGSVYLYNTPIGKYVVKETKKVNESGGYPSDFITEIDSLIKFRHVSSVVKIDGVCFDSNSGVGYIVMEPMDGNLRRWYDKAGFSQRIRALPKVITQIGGALAIIHSMKHVHNDIKNNNILTNNGQDFKLADFGKCRYITDESREYGAISRYKPYLKRSVYGEELYAFCVVLVELIIGKNMILTNKSSPDDDISLFYSAYGRDRFNVKKFLKDSLTTSQFKDIPKLFWDYTVPIFDGNNQSATEALLHIGLEVNPKTFRATKKNIAVQTNFHPKLSSVRNEAIKRIKEYSDNKLDRYVPLYDRLMSRYLYCSNLSKTKEILAYSEIVLITLLGKSYPTEKIPFNRNHLLKLQRELITAIGYQTIILAENFTEE